LALTPNLAVFGGLVLVLAVEKSFDRRQMIEIIVAFGASNVRNSVTERCLTEEPISIGGKNNG
jgi:hypothetical protein